LATSGGSLPTLANKHETHNKAMHLTVAFGARR